MRITILVSLLLFVGTTYGQVDAKFRGDKLVSVTGLVSDTDLCAPESYRGTISKITSGWPERFIWVKTPKLTKKVWLNVEDVSMAVLSHLNYNLKRGRRVNIGIQVCGSGAFPWVDSITFL